MFYFTTKGWLLFPYDYISNWTTCGFKQLAQIFEAEFANYIKKSMEALHIPGQLLNFFSSRNAFIKFHKLLNELPKIIQFTFESK